ncbi:hypothetical protein ACWCXH_33955 [Kitasatospora sp. NPDC001660]
MMILGEDRLNPVRMDASCGWRCHPENCPVCRIAALFPGGRIKPWTPTFPFDWREGLAAAGVDVPLYFTGRGPRYRSDHGTSATPKKKNTAPADDHPHES